MEAASHASASSAAEADAPPNAAAKHAADNSLDTVGIIGARPSEVMDFRTLLRICDHTLMGV
jgi:hypothetical protein